MILTIKDAQEIISSLHTHALQEFYDPTQPARISYAYHPASGNINRRITRNDTTHTDQIDARTAARKLFSERRYYNAQQRHNARLE